MPFLVIFGESPLKECKHGVIDQGAKPHTISQYSVNLQMFGIGMQRRRHIESNFFDTAQWLHRVHPNVRRSDPQRRPPGCDQCDPGTGKLSHRRSIQQPERGNEKAVHGQKTGVTTRLQQKKDGSNRDVTSLTNKACATSPTNEACATSPTNDRKMRLAA